MRSTALKVYLFALIALCATSRPAAAAPEDTSLKLALELFKQLEPTGKNLVISPYGLRTSFAMLYMGARSQTASEIAVALELNASPDVTLREEMGTLARLHEAGEKGAGELAIANGIWLQNGYNFLESYTNLIRRSFAGDLKQADFVNEPEAARRAINAWVSGVTHGKIGELIGPNVLTSLTRIVLANAVYFKGYWNVPFDPKLTAPGDFWLGKENKKPVQMMHLQSRLAVRIGKADLEENFDMLELPYKGREISFFVVLPKPGASLAEFEARVTARDLELMRRQLEPAIVALTLPKFRMKWGASLVPTLKRLGMSSAFGVTADFSGIDGSKQLMLSEALHQTFIDINEEGTEAAAATAIIGALKSARPKDEVVIFNVDRPFLFFIRLNTTNTVLFAGRAADIS